jgi:alkaline phosphatase
MSEIMAPALCVLKQDQDGFVLMAEGGAIDWASHGNLSGRLIEEQVDFDKAVEYAVEWIEKHSSWDETLLIITADHETGYLTGPRSDPVWQPLVNYGVGNLPGMEWHGKGHTNQLVPVFVKGAGAETFVQRATMIDPSVGAYMDNTAIPNTVRELWKRATP